MNIFRRSLDALRDAAVEFIVIGGVAASAHGSAQVTFDLDICYQRGVENLKRLSEALRPYHPRLRGAPEGLPFVLDANTLERGMNFTLTSDLGDIDLLGEIAGIGQYREAFALSDCVDLFGGPCRVLSLEGLIRSKRAAGRDKDLSALREIEALREMKRQGSA